MWSESRKCKVVLWWEVKAKMCSVVMWCEMKAKSVEWLFKVKAKWLLCDVKLKPKSVE
jgi:hypothetical protein